MSLPIVITMGEPAGIGPEIILKAWMNRSQAGLSSFYVIGNKLLLEQRAELLKIPCRIDSVTSSNPGANFENALPVIEEGLYLETQPGKINNKNADAVIDTIALAASHVFSGIASALVTCPIHKETLYQAGFSFPGHTEFLKHLCEQHISQPQNAVMMLSGPQLRTVPLTIHTPLKDIFKDITQQKIIQTTETVSIGLKKYFGIQKPNIAICGLNPHAGENGSLGTEELEIIIPAINKIRSKGHSIIGPISADSLFRADFRSSYDVAIAMYHDQALIPIKTLSFNENVNVTLGLPIIRTSPDHGTALDIASLGIADPAGLLAALCRAQSMVTQSQKYDNTQIYPYDHGFL